MPISFEPSAYGRNPHFQTIFSSLKVRALGRNAMAANAEELIIDTGPDARLLGYISRQRNGNSRGLILLLHGWEGSSESTYILATGRYFFNRGYDIFRLNLRDHGISHHLNKGIFHSARIDETFRAVRMISDFSNRRPYYIIGFSLGGNFALRIALKHRQSIIPNLNHVIAISPVLDPYDATLTIDSGLFLYRLYFVKKWKRSLVRKQHLFPETYDFSDVLRLRTCMEITNTVIPRYTSFPDHRSYFETYTLTDKKLVDLTVPVTIIASEDDPIIPIRQFNALQGNGNLNLLLTRHGGHCGFIDSSPFGSWYENILLGIFERNSVAW
jgi:uncharacterized protein